MRLTGGLALGAALLLASSASVAAAAPVPTALEAAPRQPPLVEVELTHGGSVSDVALTPGPQATQGPRPGSSLQGAVPLGSGRLVTRFRPVPALPWLELFAEGALARQRVAALASDTTAQPVDAKLVHFGRLVLGAGARLPATGVFAFRVQLGYELASLGVPAVTGVDPARAVQFEAAKARLHGPALGLGATLSLGPVRLALAGRGALPVWDDAAALLGPTETKLLLGAQVDAAYELPLRLLDRGTLALVADASLDWTSVTAAGPLAEAPSLRARVARVGLGVRGAWLEPRAAARPAQAPRGLVLRADGSPASDASVDVDGAPAPVAADGSFELSSAPRHGRREADEAPATGPTARVTVSLAGHRPVSRVVTLDAHGGAAPHALRFALERLDGPGSLRGRVRAADGAKPVAGATIEVAGAPAVETDAAGAFVVPRAGPGPVRLVVGAAGFAPAEEVVSIPPEAEATVELTLKRSGQPKLALLRGLVRSATGRPLKAQVKLLGSTTPVAVGADGRFVVEVKPGRWTLRISAPGHASQTKDVDVVGGDQALFHCDLQPGGP